MAYTRKRSCFLNRLELIAAILGLANVWLTVKERILAWPVGVVMVSLYIAIFADVRLYADAGLQCIFLALQFYGWYQWLHGGQDHGRLTVRRTASGLLIGLVALGGGATTILALVLRRWTDQALPFGDSAIAAFSLVAQWMLAKKLLENWLLWIAIDVIAIGVYWAKGLKLTSLLYAVFLLMCVAGYRGWRRSWRTQACRAVPHGQ